MKKTLIALTAIAALAGCSTQLAMSTDPVCPQNIGKTIAGECNDNGTASSPSNAGGGGNAFGGEGPFGGGFGNDSKGGYN